MDLAHVPSRAGHGALRELPLGAVRPAGWLLEQLRLQADGLTGHLEELWPDVGPDSAWLGGSGEDWERGPYYLDGLVPLAHLLGDEGLLAKAQRWIDALLASQRPDGSFGPESNPDWWPRMVAVKALVQHAEATGDEAIVEHLARWFRHQLDHLDERPLADWGAARAADAILGVLWLHERRPEPWLLELADRLDAQALDWDAFFADLPTTPAERFDHTTHVVNVAMALKGPAVRFRRDGDPGRLATLLAQLDALDRHHGQVQGMFGGDEWLAGTEPHHGVELCAVVELMFSLEQALLAFGEGALADRLETVAYNALPATLSADLRAHQYHQQPNQVLCTIADREWTYAGPDANLFGLEPNFGCCTANLHQGWPKLVRHMWMGTPEGGIALVVHGPSTVTAPLGGAQATLEARTAYPFEEEVVVAVSLDRPARFGLELRVPGWCAAPVLRVNGVAQPAETDERGFLRVEREWRDGDQVELELGMALRPLPRPRGALGLALGPLVLAASPGEVWSRLPGTEGFGDWEVRNRSAWNWGLALDPEALPACEVQRGPVPSPPFSLRDGRPGQGPQGAPVRVRVPVRKVPAWSLRNASAPPPPESPAATTMPLHTAHLVPYGSARLRIAEFPRVAPED